MPVRRKRTPQEKKRLSYERDCRNIHGETDKGPRKTIPRFKAASNRAMRHATKQLVSTEAAEARLTDRTFKGLHPVKRKAADAPLGQVIAANKQKRVWRTHGKARRRVKGRTGNILP